MAILIHKRRIRRVTDLEAAYLAGIIDGEGCISFRKRGRLLFPVVAITNTSRPLVLWLKGLCVRNPRMLAAPKKFKGRVTPAWQLEWSAVRDVYRILELVEPYLLVKRTKARRALSILRRRYGRS